MFFCGIVYNSTPFYFQKNLQGDIIAITDKDGEVVARYTYDAWGKCTVDPASTNTTIANLNPYRYRGYYYDSEIGMYYLQSRYYDPEVGRFLNGDAIEFAVYEQDVLLHNLFGYCGNEPVGYADEDGNITFFRAPKSPSSYRYKGTILTISEFKFESKFIASNLKKINVFMNVVTIKETEKSLINAWNNLSACDVVIINCHGTTFSINKMDFSEAQQLKKKNVRLVISLACNSGHYDWTFSNSGYAFYKKIKGYGRVLCPDGAVRSPYIFNPFSTFKVKINDDWRQYSSRKKSYGWIIYEKGYALNKIYISNFGIKINLKNVVKRLLGDDGYCSPKKSIAV